MNYLNKFLEVSKLVFNSFVSNFIIWLHVITIVITMVLIFEITQLAVSVKELTVSMQKVQDVFKAYEEMTVPLTRNR